MGSNRNRGGGDAEHSDCSRGENGEQPQLVEGLPEQEQL